MKSKYAKFGEDHSMYECTIWSCKWQGTEDKKKLKRHNKYSHELVCPACGNNEFYGLLDERVDELLENKKEELANNINEVSNICHGLAVDAGWHDKPREAGTMLALIHSEVSEALEGFRKDLNDDHLVHRKMAEVELADTVIRIFDLAGSQGFDVGSAMMEKLIYNTRRKDHKIENRNKENGKKF